MKPLGDMSPEELAGCVCQALRDVGVTVTLSGGACVGIWSEGKYVSNDLDFIEEGPVPRRKVRDVLRGLGFAEKGRHFVHPDTKFFIEFPTGPLMVGDERVERVVERATPGGLLRLLSPTDCVKDRLAAFFHWNDWQSLEQALLVVAAQSINMKDVRRWAEAEGNAAKFQLFEERARSLPGSAKRKGNGGKTGRGKGNRHAT